MPMLFPLRKRPKQDYHHSGLSFGTTRPNGRVHAACDLIAAEGSEILAVEDGYVIGNPYLFYHGTYALEVNHMVFTVRYCEIRAAADGLRAGSRVKRGQVIAYVGKMDVDAMLHFEMYRGSESGPLTVKGNQYQRRKDLMDPTPFLDQAVMITDPAP